MSFRGIDSRTDALTGIPAATTRAAPDLQGERKRVTVMFADIAGFTALAEAMDPEDVRDLVNACFERLVPVIERYEGTVDKFMGDEVMALFGAPIAHENDPERALRCALAMREALAGFNVERGTDLGIHFGINTGLVVAGGVGTAGRRDYSVMGDAVNLASRLEEASQPGEILVGPDTYRLTNRLFQFEAAGPLKLKGKSEPVAAYKVMGAHAAPPGPFEAREISSRLVGRDTEVGVFTGAVERLLEGRGGLVAIVGEAGLGKSRLVAEVCRYVAGTGLSWIEGRALSFGRHISYWPFLEIIQADAGITIEDDEAARWAKLSRRVEGLFPDEAAEFLPYLATLLALEVPGELAERVKYVDGETMGRQVFRSARRFFARMAEERPLVLVFEDVHWLDESSALLLEHLLPLVREVPLLICAVGRTDPDTPSEHLRRVANRDYADCYREIVLAPLSTSESAQLANSLLGIDELPPTLGEAILRKAEGNPFYVEEVIRGLIDRGGLVRAGGTGRWQATPQAEQMAIPDTLQGVIVARLDRLDEELKGVLRLAAVIGRSFFYRVLQGIAEAEQELDGYLAELEGMELIREKGRLPELEYIFKHALVQEATYESILLQRRRELHRRVGLCIEQLFADRLDEFYGLLAYHYARAEQWEKAQDYLFKAGDQASNIAADAEALAHYRHALAAYERAFGNKWDPVQRAALERKMGEALFRRGEHEHGREYLERALRTLGCPYPTSRWGIRLAIVRQVARQMAQRSMLWLLTKSAQTRGRADEELCHIYYAMAWMDYFLDPERHTLDVLLDLEAAERCGLHLRAIEAYGGIGVVCDAIGLRWLASRCHSRAATSADRFQQPVAIGHAYLFLALHEHYALGKWDLAKEHYNRAAAALWEAGRLREWACAGVLLGKLLAEQGELDAALELSRKVAHVSRDTADPQALAWGLLLWGAAQDEAGTPKEAEAKLQEATHLLKGIPDYLSAVFAIGILARCLLRQEKTQEALVVLEEGRQLIARHRLMGFLCVPVWMSFAQDRLKSAEQAETGARAAALKDARQACRTALNQGKLDRGLLVAAYRMQGTCEWLRGKTGAARRWWQRSLDLAEKLGARYELGMTHLEVGKRTGDRAPLERAEAIFTAIGAQLDLEQAQALQGDA